MNYVMKHDEWPEIDETTGERKEYRVHEGEIWHMRTGEDVMPLEARGDPIFDDVIQALSDAIERQTIPGPGFGMPQGINSGYMANTLQVAGTLHFEPVEEHLKEGLERIGTLILRLIQSAGQTVFVRNHGKSGYLGLGPDDIGPYLPELVATVREKPPMDYPALVQTAANAVQSGLWDIFTGREVAAPPSGLGPEEIEQRIQSYQMVTSQSVQQLMLQKLMEDINRKFAERDAQQHRVTPDMLLALPEEARQAMLQAGIQYITQGGSMEPGVFDALAAGGMGTPPQGMGMGGDMGMDMGASQLAMPPAGGAPNLNVPSPGMNRPAPPPTSGLASGQIPQQGGRRAGSRRQPGGPQRGPQA